MREREGGILESACDNLLPMHCTYGQQKSCSPEFFSSAWDHLLLRRLRPNQALSRRSVTPGISKIVWKQHQHQQQQQRQRQQHHQIQQEYIFIETMALTSS